MFGAVVSRRTYSLPLDAAGEPIPQPRRRRWLRRIQLTAAWLGVFALGSALLWAITWLNLPRPAALVLWGAGYQQNLSVPHNVYGWRTLVDLSALAQHGERFTWSGSWLQLEQPPTEIRSDSPWREWLDDVQGPTLVLYVSLHGAADDEGAYLLLADASEAGENERLRIDDLLDRLAQLPPEQHKLLMLDATQIESHWRLGILHNEFARALAELDDRIAGIPGLVVIGSSDVNQRSWVCEEHGRTTFGHYLIEALHGAVHDDDGDSRIDAAEMYEAVRGNVARWARVNRAALQTPVLLPRGELGRRRAEKIDLGATSKGYRTPEAQLLPEFVPPKPLLTAWQRYEQLVKEQPWGFGYAPTFWREYQDTLIRYEELIRAGDEPAAAQLLDRLQGLEYRMRRERAQNLGSLQNSLAMQAASGLAETQQKPAMQTLNELWNAAPADHADIWARALKQAGDAVEAPALLRIAVFQALVDRVGENPADNLAPAAAIVDVIADPLQPRPAEVHFAMMLHRYLPAQALTEEGGQRVRRALQVRCQAERAAVGMQGDGYAFSELVSPWLEEVMADGDRERRLGEDLLFAGPADRAKADGHLEQAGQLYERALGMAAKLQTALRTRDEVLERLPYYSRWLAGTVLDDYVSDPRYEAMLDQVENLWRETHRLELQLERGDVTELDRAPPPTAHDPQPRSIVDRTQVIKLHYGQVVQQYHEVAEALAGGHAASDWHAVQHALLVPPSDWRLRMKLLEARRKALHRRLSEQRRGSKEGKQPSAHQTAARADQGRASLLPSRSHTPRKAAHHADPAAALKQHSAEPRITAQEQQRQVMRSAQWQGRLALAMLGERLFEESYHPAWETFDQVRHRLDVFEVEQQWWRSLIAAGKQIEYRWRWMPRRIDKMVHQAPKADDAHSLAALELADRLARQIDGAQGATLSTRPTALYRCRRLHDLTLVQADRALGDRWYDLDPNDEPYFRKAGLAYLADAQRLDPASKATQTVRERLMQAAGLAVAPMPRRHLTTQRLVEVEYRLTFAGKDDRSAAPPLGYPVAWIEGDKALEVIQPQQGARVVRRLGPDNRTASILCTLKSPVLAAAEKKPPHAETVDPSALTLHGFFRGQQLTGRVPVELHLLPETTVHFYPRPAQASVSLIATPELHRELGDGAGAVAFVLDCSGSMGLPEGQDLSSGAGLAEGQVQAPRSKFVEAVAALREVLQTLPPGVQVSVWMFGQAVGTDRTALDPATTIRRVQDPVVWNPRDRGQLETLMAKVSPARVVPWNKSPVVRTILAAKADVLDAPGFKTIVVITDGVDNCFAGDTVANPQGQSIQAALTEAFRDDGVALNVIGFKVTSGEEQEARQQFEVVESFFPPGGFYVVNQSAALASTLSTALRQRLRYWLENYEGKATERKGRRLFEVGNPSGGELWFAEPLQPGTYQLRVSADRRVRAEVTLAPGDLLPLELDRSTGGLTVSRLAYARKRFPGRPNATADDWRATVLNAQLLGEQQVQLSLALEKNPRPDAGRLQQIRPRQVWMEISPEHRSHAPGAVEWGGIDGYPMPVFSLRASSWPVNAQGAAARPTMELWWNADQETPASAVLKRTARHKTLTDLAGAVIQAADESVSVESVDVEQRFVEVSPGVRNQQPCLVVRLTYSPGKVLWARPEGTNTAAAEHRFYPSIGQYTGLFWPITREQAEKQLRGIGVVSLETLKRDAQSRGCTLRIDDIPAPQPGDVRPSPSQVFP